MSPPEQSITGTLHFDHPVPNLSFVWKVVEKLVALQLQRLLEKTDLSSDWAIVCCICSHLWLNWDGASGWILCSLISQ